MEQVSQYMYNYALILQIGPKKQHVQGVPIDISFLGGGTPSPHDKAWFRARNWNMKDWLPEKPDVDDHGMTVCG